MRKSRKIITLVELKLRQWPWAVVTTTISTFFIQILFRIEVSDSAPINIDYQPLFTCVAKWTHAIPIAILSITVSLLEIIDVKVNDLPLSRSRACHQMLSSNSFLPSRCSVFSFLVCSKMKIISFVFFPSRSWMWFIFRLNFALVYHFGWGCERISND